MRRATAIALLGVALSACGQGTPRPEGVVERWLTSLNQGASGEPHAWADDEPTAALAPDWETRQPGEYDSIVVGAVGDDGTVPFRVTDTDGRELGGRAIVGIRDTGEHGDHVVWAVELTDPPPSLDGAWAPGAGTAGWLMAAGLSVLVAGIAALAVRLARPRDPIA